MHKRDEPAGMHNLGTATPLVLQLFLKQMQFYIYKFTFQSQNALLTKLSLTQLICTLCLIHFTLVLVKKEK